MSLHEKTNGERAAFPFDGAGGLTKREHFAGVAMEGLLSSLTVAVPAQEIAGMAVTMADALLRELDLR